MTDIERLDFSKGPPPGWVEVKPPPRLDCIWPWRTRGLRLPGPSNLRNGETAVGVHPTIIYQKKRNLKNSHIIPLRQGGEKSG